VFNSHQASGIKNTKRQAIGKKQGSGNMHHSETQSFYLEQIENRCPTPEALTYKKER